MLSATASLGLVLLWDVEGGLTEIDKFLYSNEESIKVRIHTQLTSSAAHLSLYEHQLMCLSCRREHSWRVG